jgi:hypothetical protein
MIYIILQQITLSGKRTKTMHQRHGANYVS